MLKKIIKTVLMLSLFTLLVFGEGSHSDNDGGSRNDDIGNIIKNSSIENSQSEKERNRRGKRKKDLKQKRKKEKKEKNREYFCLKIITRQI